MKKGLIRKEIKPAFYAHFLALFIFIIIFLTTGNYEFMGYVGVILVVMWLILRTDKNVKYSPALVWMLTVWSILHMAGGGLYINGARLYDFMFFELIGAPYYILKYDQVIHAYGFFVATILCYDITRKHLKKGHPWFALSFVLVMAGLGMGALNEIIEFFVSLTVPGNGVGGYENTSLDLIANLVGAIIAMWTIRRRAK